MSARYRNIVAVRGARLCEGVRKRPFVASKRYTALWPGKDSAFPQGTRMCRAQIADLSRLMDAGSGNLLPPITNFSEVHRSDHSFQGMSGISAGTTAMPTQTATLDDDCFSVRHGSFAAVRKASFRYREIATEKAGRRRCVHSSQNRALPNGGSKHCLCSTDWHLASLVGSIGANEVEWSSIGTVWRKPMPADLG